MSFYHPYYSSSDDMRLRFSPDPTVRLHAQKVMERGNICHEILSLAQKPQSTEAINTLFESKKVDLSTAYERFDFTAWLDLGGGFVGRNVTVFQAALLKPETYQRTTPDAINGMHTGETFKVLLSLLNNTDDKSILLHQDCAGRTVLHMAAYFDTGNGIVAHLLDFLDANGGFLKEELLQKTDLQGNTPYYLAHPCTKHLLLQCCSQNESEKPNATERESRMRVGWMEYFSNVISVWFSGFLKWWMPEKKHKGWPKE